MPKNVAGASSSADQHNHEHDLRVAGASSSSAPEPREQDFRVAGASSSSAPEPREQDAPATPRLRFPEFQDTGEWIIKSFGELFTIGNGRDYKHLHAGDVPVYGSGGYMLSVNDYLYDGESVCIGRKGTINNPLFLTGRFWTVDTLFYTYSFKKCLPKFIFAIFQQIDWLKHNEAGGVPSLSKTNIQKIQTAIPPTLAEQQRIADCLSSLDALIAAQARKVDALKSHKKGLMQQLFPRDGETQPRLRFPEFQDAGEWALGAVSNYLCESRIPSPLNDPSKRITVRLHLQGVEHREHRGTESTESTNNFCRKAGQFIYGKQNVHKGAFGIVPAHLDGFETSQDLPCFDFKPHCHPLWFYYHLSRENVYCPLELQMTGTGSKRLNEKTFLALPISAPKYAEQQRIADCLSSLDALIAAQARKVDALKSHKKGLMQQLFPNVEEIES